MKKYLVFAYGNTHSGFVYYELSSLELNDGTSVEKLALNFSYFKKKLWKNDFVGSIHDITEGDDGKFTYRTGSAALGYWKNQDDVTGWRAMQVAKDEQGKVVKEGKVNQLKEALQPVREIYVQAGYSERRLILAEVIRLITGG